MLKKTAAFIITFIGLVGSLLTIWDVTSNPGTISQQRMLLLFVIASFFAITSIILLIMIINIYIVSHKKIILENFNGDLFALYHELAFYDSIINLTKKFKLNKIDYTYEFRDQSFTSIKHYVGEVTSFRPMMGFPFILAGDKNEDYEHLNCFAYDLNKDPERKVKIRPQGIKTTGLYLVAEYPFEKKLKKGEKFDIEIYYTWPMCVIEGTDYIYASPNAKHRNFSSFNVILRFWKPFPQKVYKYRIDGNKRVENYGEFDRYNVIDKSDYIEYQDFGISLQPERNFFVYVYTFIDN